MKLFEIKIHGICEHRRATEMINLVFYANFTGGRTHVPALGGRGEPGGGVPRS